MQMRILNTQGELQTKVVNVAIKLLIIDLLVYFVHLVRSKLYDALIQSGWCGEHLVIYADDHHVSFCFRTLKGTVHKRFVGQIKDQKVLKVPNGLMPLSPPVSAPVLHAANPSYPLTLSIFIHKPDPFRANGKGNIVTHLIKKAGVHKLWEQGPGANQEALWVNLIRDGGLASAAGELVVEGEAHVQRVVL
ncbi:hypothetical protein AK812_SmicGene45629, partial [Symbiodinium microadriaticum]